MNIWRRVDKLSERKRKINGKRSGHCVAIAFPIRVEVELLETGGSTRPKCSNKDMDKVARHWPFDIMGKKR
jgi:hypothetical protein